MASSTISCSIRSQVAAQVPARWRPARGLPFGATAGQPAADAGAASFADRWAPMTGAANGLPLWMNFGPAMLSNQPPAQMRRRGRAANATSAKQAHNKPRKAARCRPRSPTCRCRRRRWRARRLVRGRCAARRTIAQHRRSAGCGPDGIHAGRLADVRAGQSDRRLATGSVRTRWPWPCDSNSSSRNPGSGGTEANAAMRAQPRRSHQQRHRSKPRSPAHAARPTATVHADPSGPADISGCAESRRRRAARRPATARAQRMSGAHKRAGSRDVCAKRGARDGQLRLSLHRVRLTSKGWPARGLSLVRSRVGSVAAPWSGAWPDPPAPPAPTRCRMLRRSGSGGTRCAMSPRNRSPRLISCKSAARRRDHHRPVTIGRRRSSACCAADRQPCRRRSYYLAPVPRAPDWDQVVRGAPGQRPSSAAAHSWGQRSTACDATPLTDRCIARPSAVVGSRLRHTSGWAYICPGRAGLS